MSPAPHAWFPDAEQRATLNTALLATGTDSGYCDQHGRPAPSPDDIDEWRPSDSDPITFHPGEQPF